jgi:hypothetical protein
LGAGKKAGIGIGAVIAAIAVLAGIGGYQADTPTQPTITQPSVQQQENRCDSSYPDFCIPPSSPDLDCSEIQYRNFRVLPPDRHGFDRDNDGIGCEG